MIKQFQQCLFNMPKLFNKNIFYRSNSKPNQDLYQLLGVNKGADQKQIKKAYYKLAQQYHPDKNPSPQAKQKFTKINNAYQILSDGQKRQVYDQTGNTGQGNAAGFNQSYENVNFDDIFKNFGGFNQQSGGGFQDIFSQVFGGGFNQRNSGKRQQSQPSVMNLSINFDESVKGANKILQYQKKSTCSTCKGSKCKPGTQPQVCRSCNGTGKQTIRQGMFIMQTQCGVCQGEGKVIKHPCNTCSGTGVQKKKVKQQVAIPRGINDGMTLQLKNKGNFNNDLFLKVSVKKHSSFVRQGINVVSQIQISVLDAILGAQKDVKTIEGTTKKVKIPSGLQPGQKITISNQGFYMVNSSNKGDHILNVKIQIPKTLTVQERTFYQQIKNLK